MNMPDTASFSIKYGAVVIAATALFAPLLICSQAQAGLSVFYDFTGGADGAHPSAPLTLSGSTLYGTTFHGTSGDGFGTVFKPRRLISYSG